MAIVRRRTGSMRSFDPRCLGPPSATPGSATTSAGGARCCRPRCGWCASASGCPGRTRSTVPGSSCARTRCGRRFRTTIPTGPEPRSDGSTRWSLAQRRGIRRRRGRPAGGRVVAGAPTPAARRPGRRPCRPGRCPHRALRARLRRPTGLGAAGCGAAGGGGAHLGPLGGRRLRSREPCDRHRTRHAGALVRRAARSRSPLTAPPQCPTPHPDAHSPTDRAAALPHRGPRPRTRQEDQSCP